MKINRNYCISGEIVTRKTFFEFLKICAKNEWIKSDACYYIQFEDYYDIIKKTIRNGGYGCFKITFASIPTKEETLCEQVCKDYLRGEK